MNPRDFNHIAAQLVSQGDPVACRTAIGRAYYAAFNVAAELLREMGFHIGQNAAAHDYIAKLLNSSEHREVQSVAGALRTLRTSRNHADYRMAKKAVENPKTADGLVQQSVRSIKTLDRCCSGPDRDRIIKSIQKREHLLSRPEPL